MTFDALVAAAMRKRAAALLTPEAEQAAVQPPPQDPSMMGGAPMDPSMMQGGGMPPQGAPMDPSMQGGMPPQGGGQLPPEILQDQQFIQWLQQQGVAFDPNSGMFIDTQSGQPIPPEAIMQAYQQYMMEMQGGQGMPRQGGQPMPPAQGGAPMDPSMMGGGAPMRPEAQGQGGLPPEIAQDQMFMQFMQEAMGAAFDPNSGMFMDMQSGQPIPPDYVMQAYQQYQQAMMAQQGGAPQGMPQDPSMMGGAQMDPAMMQQGQAQPGLPPEIMDQIQSTIDSSLKSFTTQLDKKIETLLDKLETVKMALESMRDTDDARTADDKQETDRLRAELSEELNPTVKTASAPQPTKQGETPKTRNLNMFEILKQK